MCPCFKCFVTDAKNKDASCLNECRYKNVGCPVFSNETIIEQPTDFTLLTEKYNKAAIKFIEDSVHEHKKPFFLYMGYHQTHHPQFASKSINKTKKAFSLHGCGELLYVTMQCFKKMPW